MLKQSRPICVFLLQPACDIYVPVLQHVPAALECPMRNVRSLYMKEFYFREDPVLGKYFPDIPV